MYPASLITFSTIRNTAVLQCIPHHSSPNPESTHRTKGLTLQEFKESLGVILELNNRDVDSISEEVLYPAVPVHHYRTVFMSVK
jgi:hypothetical protein